MTLEQLIDWDPDAIFVNGEPKQNLSGPQVVQEILKNPSYSTLKAVKTGKVYGIPKGPFAWLGRPTGQNQLIGIIWVGHILYPDHFDYDLNEAVTEFYRLFYHLELTEGQIQDLYKE